MECPKCNSENVENLGLTIVEYSDMQALPADEYKCNDCGYKFKMIR